MRLSMIAALLAAGCECGAPGGDDAGADAGGDAGKGDAGPEPEPVSAISFPQAIAGVMLANPDVYAEVPVHLAVTGGPALSVTLDAGGDPIDATDEDADGDWIAIVPIEALDGEVALEATADGVSATATLVVVRGGVQLTDFGAVGPGLTPRLHREGDALYLTWTQFPAGDRAAWLQELDGAARATGDPVRISASGTAPIYARTAFGGGAIGVLYQEAGGPYVNRFRAVMPDGSELIGPIDLDGGRFGSSGGAIAWDGAAWVIVWRVNDGAGSSEVFFARIEPGGAMTGPASVAASGAGDATDPRGAFDPFTPLSIAPGDGESLIAFVCDRYMTSLDTTVHKAELFRIANDGTVIESGFAGSPTDFLWYHEHRVFPTGAVWTTTDLTADPSPTTLWRDGEALIDDQPENRTEPFLAAHPLFDSVMLWIDDRDRDVVAGTGGLRLYAAGLEGTELVGQAVFEHARFIEGTSEVNGVAAGTNVTMVWIDERHGSGLFDPRPEIFFETVWF